MGDKHAAATTMQKHMRGATTRVKTLPELKTPSSEDGGDVTCIKVCVRVRPLGEGRGERGDRVHVDSVENKMTIQAQGKRDTESHTFDFESVFEKEDNPALAEMVGKPIVASVCQGYNGTLFAYGQTGSGKTYTIGEMAKLGTAHEGVAHRMIRDLYVQAMQCRPRSFTVTVQFVQVYVERVYDLLAEPKMGEASKLTLREDKHRGVYVEGALSVPAASADECLGVLEKASGNLKCAEQPRD